MIFTNAWGIFAVALFILSVMVKSLVVSVFLFFAGAPSDSLSLMFWNLENFFDYIDGGAGDSDSEFSSGGARHWTKKRFYEKCGSVAKVILWLGSTRGRLPDVIGMAEVENRFVLRQLVSTTALKKLDYEVVHYDSPDPRGIDCALLYRTSRLRLAASRPCRVGGAFAGISSAGVLPAGGSFFAGSSTIEPLSVEPSAVESSAGDAPQARDTLQTRDILLAQFITPSGDSLAVLVNHHPSKYGGGETDWRREVAIERLRAVSDSIAAEGWHWQIALGDFNDTPDNPLFSRLAPALLLSRYGSGSSGSVGSASSMLVGSFSSGPAGSASSMFAGSTSSGPVGTDVRSVKAGSVSGRAGDNSDRGVFAGHFDAAFKSAVSSVVGRSSADYVPKGSIRFNGEWQLIDLCFSSPDLAPSCSFVAVPIPFLTDRDAAHSGEKPLRTYSGPRYLGGVSDHLPILVELIF